MFSLVPCSIDLWLDDLVPLFRSPCPVFLPFDHAGLINLTLDSNVMFFKEEKIGGGYTLIDMYALKGNPPIAQGGKSIDFLGWYWGHFSGQFWGHVWGHYSI